MLLVDFVLPNIKESKVYASLYIIFYSMFMCKWAKTFMKMLFTIE